MRTLVTGGVRSGKSHHAEQLVLPHADVTYVATGPDETAEPDPDWAERLRVHRERRPAAWALRETLDLAAAVLDAPGAVLVDCLGTWVTRLIDHHGLWEAPSVDVHEAVAGPTRELTDVLGRVGGREVVLVTNEVGLGVVPSHRSGAVFRDVLGTVNREVAAAVDDVHLVVAGRVLRL